jgi:hypothetical protein
MHKLSGNRLDKFNKSCRVFTRNLTKLGLHFSEFSMIFYAFYKILQNSNTIQDSNFLAGPLELFRIHTNALTLH